MGSFWDDDDRPTLGLDEEDRRQASEEENLLRAAFEENRRRVDDVFDVYRDVVARYLKYAEAMEDGSEKEELKNALWRLRYRLMQGPVRLLILGASSAGKSTIVNALAGRVVSPEARQVSTLIPAWIKGVAKTPGNKPACYTLCFGGDTKEEYFPQADYLKTFCHPPEDRNSKPEGIYAVRVETAGGFLAENGLTLLDTPGTGQTDTESHMAMETAELGAELLLLATRKDVFESEETELFRRLICDEKHGLGLCPPKDVFCLFNEEELNQAAYNTNAKETFRDLTSGCDRDAQLDLKNRYYAVNAIEERRKREYYEFTNWSPKGVGEGSFEELSSIEEEEKNVYSAVAGKPPSPEMQRLLDDLRHRVWDIYADPERILGPIERRLQEAAQVLLNDCRRDIQKEKQRVAEEVRKTPVDQLTDPKLAVLLGEKARLESSANYVVKQAQSLDEDCKSLLQDIERTANGVHTQMPVKAELYTGIFLLGVSTNADLMNDGKFGEILQPIYYWFIKSREEWQKLITDQELELIKLDRYGIQQQLRTILETFNSIAEEAGKYEKTGAAYNVDAEVCAWAKKFEQSVADCLAPKDAIDDGASQLREYVHERLRAYRAEWPSANNIIDKMKRGWRRMDYESEIKMVAREQLNSALAQDAVAYHECLCRERARLEGWFETLRQKVKIFAKSIGAARGVLKEQIEAREEFCRDEIYKQLMEERVTPLEGAAANFQEFIDFLNEKRGARAKI